MAEHKSFIQVYYEDVDRWLGDPQSARRYTPEHKLRDLHAVNTQVFEDLLNLLGSENLFGYAEATIALVAGKSFYQLPEGFRQFLALERREYSGDEIVRVMNRLLTKGLYSNECAIELLTSHRGFRLFPPLTADYAADWTLCFVRAPGKLHYAQATAVTLQTLTTGTPPEDGGRVMLRNDYYNNMELRVYNDDNGVEQYREIVDSTPQNGHMVLKLRHPFEPLPVGDVWYEVRPLLPPEYDGLYALDSALQELGRRGLTDRKGAIAPDRTKLWNAAKSYYQSNTMDRVSRIIQPMRRAEDFMVGENPCL